MPCQILHYTHACSLSLTIYLSMNGINSLCQMTNDDLKIHTHLHQLHILRYHPKRRSSSNVHIGRVIYLSRVNYCYVSSSNFRIAFMSKYESITICFCTCWEPAECMTLRVRLANGITQRIDVHNTDSLGSFEDHIRQSGYHTPSIRGYKWKDMIYKMSDPRTCNLQVKDFDFKSGDLLTAITDPSPLTQKKKSSINPTTSSLPRSRFGSLKDFADEMSPSVDIMKGSHHIGLPVVIRYQLYPIIAKIRDGGDVALLLGETSVVSEDEMSATSIQAAATGEPCFSCCQAISSRHQPTDCWMCDWVQCKSLEWACWFEAGGGISQQQGADEAVVGS
jgi:hypothetical protein